MVMLTPREQKLVDAGTALARSIGHDPYNKGRRDHGCPKMSPAIPCTCGCGKLQAEALDNWLHLIVEITSQELGA